jgi:plastocyanin
MSSMEPGTPASGVLLSCDISDAAVASALEAAAAMAGGGGEATPEAQAAAATTEFAVEAIDIAYDVKSLEIPANTDVTITITNNGVAVHDFNIEGTDIASGFINGGGSTATVTVNLAPGEYTFFCSVPGHRAAGMVGTLTVK